MVELDWGRFELSCFQKKFSSYKKEKLKVAIVSAALILFIIHFLINLAKIPNERLENAQRLYHHVEQFN